MDETGAGGGGTTGAARGAAAGRGGVGGDGSTPVRHALLPDPDPAQAAALSAGPGNLLVLGAPGTGRTSLALRLAADRALELAAQRARTGHAGGSAADGGVLLLTPQRERAEALGLTLARQLAGTGAHVDVRTPAALAFAVTTQYLGALGEPLPTLLTGADVDAALAELLAGHAEGLGALPPWPSQVRPETLVLGAFRDELRDLLTRAAEEGLTAAQLAELGRRHGRPVWEAAAVVMREYEDVVILGDVGGERGRRFDHARVLAGAADFLARWRESDAHASRPRWSLVVVDDYQDATPALTRLLREMARDGARLVLTGDPDVAVEQFRGGRAHLVGEAALPADAAHPTGLGAEIVRLGTGYRGDEALRSVWRLLAGHIRPTTTGGAHRLAAPAGAAVPGDAAGPGSGDGERVTPDPDTAPAQPPETEAPVRPETVPALRAGASGLQLYVCDSARAEEALLARRLREEHVLAGTPYSRMAVLVRSSSEVTRVRAALRVAGVPTESSGPSTALRDEPAVRPLLLAVGLAVEDARTGTMDADVVRELLLSVVGGLTAVQVQVLQRALRAQGEADEDPATLLVAALRAFGAGERTPRERGLLKSAEEGLARVARSVVAARAALGTRTGAGSERLVPASAVLWAAWQGTDLAGLWQGEALRGGPGAERAHADLDAVLSLFAAAERFDERTSGQGIEPFLQMVRAQDLPQDTLGRRGRRAGAVDVRTAASAAGREWDVVAVAGVQEESWPDLRIRDTLLGAGDLVDLVTAGGAAGLARDGREKRRQVLDDELRLFLAALSRASRLALVTAASDPDVRPSMFLEALAGDTDVDELRVETPEPLTLRGLVGELRRAAEHGAMAALEAAGTSGVAQAEGRAAAALLGVLAERGIAEASPRAWSGHGEPTSDRPLVPEGERVRVSPSAVGLARTCGLRWLLTRHGGDGQWGDSATVGTLVHRIAEEHPHGTPQELRDALDRELPSLGLRRETWRGRLRIAEIEEMVGRLAGYIAAAGDVDVRVEVPLGATEVGERAVVAGRTDRLENRAGPDESPRWQVVDFKTGSSALTANEAAVDPQLATYQLAVDGLDGGSAQGAALVYLAQGKPEAPKRLLQEPLGADPEPRDDGAQAQGAGDGPGGVLSRATAIEMVDDAARIMGGSVFVPTVGAHCRTCPVIDVCPARSEARENS